MKNKTAKQIVKEYKFIFCLIIFAYVAALAFLIFIMTKNLLFGIAGVVVLGVSVRAPFDKLREKTVENVIYEELDPEKFGEILALGMFKRSIHAKMLHLMSTGAHGEILELIKEGDGKVKNPLDRCNNLYREGYVYFERGEYEKLLPIYQKYESLKRENPKYVPILNNFSVFEKFDAFADDDFEYVIDVCDIDLKEINPQKQNYKLTKINVSFYRAVSLYKLGRLDEAKQGFEDIIDFAPKMYKAKLSRDFIELIDKAQ
ncbi:MAG: hypothetical protein IKA84_04750 [Clostridia bacterium]|nr:hypothetical protein [Clostridia bacterium]